MARINRTWLSNTYDSFHSMKVVAALANLVRTLQATWAVRYGVVEKELELLGLGGVAFTPKQLLSAIERYLSISIEVIVCPFSRFPVQQAQLQKKGYVSFLHYDFDERVAKIYLLDTLSRISLVAALYHELGHIVAGDHWDRSRYGAPPEDEYVAITHPATNMDVADKGANLRSLYCFSASVVGDSSVSEDDKILSLD